MLMSIYGRLDSVMLERILPESISASQAGVFGAAFRFLEALVNIAFLFAAILLPLFSKMLKNNENLKPIIKSTFSLLFFFSVTAVVLLFVYRTSLFSYFYYDTLIIEGGAQVFAILIPCLIAQAMVYLFGTLLTANGSLKALNITSAIAIFVNITINFTLIPILHARGAAIAGLVTQSSVALMQLFIALKLLKIPFSTLPYFKCLIYLCLIIVSTYLARQYVDFGLLYNLLLCGCMAFVWAFATKLIPIRFIIEIFTKTPE
jgi:O-antigen/teichoic acid export membrane protein